MCHISTYKPGSEGDTGRLQAINKYTEQAQQACVAATQTVTVYTQTRACHADGPILFGPPQP